MICFGNGCVNGDVLCMLTIGLIILGSLMLQAELIRLQRERRRTSFRPTPPTEPPNVPPPLPPPGRKGAR